MEFEACCEPLLRGEKKASTAEALMRSRYTAYATGRIDYIRDTTHPKNRDEFEEESAKKWSKDSEWGELEIVSTKNGEQGDTEGEVEFLATYTQDDEEIEHHEVAQFKREKDTWYFTDGKFVGPETFVREQPKVGRNEPCPCGSGKKYKKCCG
jgi:SEC-C motif-containing protein